MPLTMRSTGLGAGIDKDRPDYTVYSGEWAVGRIYETRGDPDNLRWFCGAPSSKYCGRHALGGGTSCTKAVAEPRKRPHFLVGSWLHGGASTRKITKRALFRELPDMKLHRSSPDAHRGAARMAKRNFIFDEGSVEAVERLRKQDEEFCRRLRIAVEMGDEFCPTTVITAPCTSRPVLNYMRTD